MAYDSYSFSSDDLAVKLKSVKILERFWTRSLSVRLFCQPFLNHLRESAFHGGFPTILTTTSDQS